MADQWNQFENMTALRRRLYRMLEPSGPEQVTAAGLTPAMDIVRGADGLVLTVELPGMAREDISVELEGDLLTISGERRRPEVADQRTLRRERPAGRFSRALSLAGGRYGEISAALQDGVLTVRVRPRGEGGEG